MPQKRLRLIVWTSAAALLGAGCSQRAVDPRFEQRTAERSENIHAVVDRFTAREAEGPERIAAVGRLIDEGRDRHETNLRRTWAYLQNEQRKDEERWPRTWAATRAKLAEELAGDSASINDVIPRMFY